MLIRRQWSMQRKFRSRRFYRDVTRRIARECLQRSLLWISTLTRWLMSCRGCETGIRGNDSRWRCCCRTIVSWRHWPFRLISTFHSTRTDRMLLKHWQTERQCIHVTCFTWIIRASCYLREHWQHRWIAFLCVPAYFHVINVHCVLNVARTGAALNLKEVVFTLEEFCSLSIVLCAGRLHYNNNRKTIEFF